MNKKRLTILALMTALLMVLSLTLFVACNNAEDAATEKEAEETATIDATEGLLISNSDFKVVSTDSDAKYPLSITSWTGASMYSSATYPDDVIAGAISLEQSLYVANKSTWKDDDESIYNLLKSHYSSDADAVNNALMIYMPTKAEITNSEDYGPTAYGYTSSSFSLEATKYYKLSVDVLTYKIAGTLDDEGNPEESATPGARIYISSNAYAEFATINTNGEWKTYTFFIEAGATSSTSLTIQLGLGKYTSEYKTGLTTGYAFFDNVALEEVESSVYFTAETTTRNGNESISASDYQATNQTFTVKVPNGRFDFGTTTVGSSATASNWSVVTDGNAPTSLGKNGVINVVDFDDDYTSYASSHYEKSGEGDATATNPATRLANDNFPTIIKNFGDNRVGTNVYMLSQQKMTANGLKSSKTITIEKGKYYTLSVSVLTFDIHGAGVSIKLTGDGKDIVMSGIGANRSDNEFKDGYYDYSSTATNGAWTTYTFYIAGNQYKDMTYNITLWLGTGNTYDNTPTTYTEYESATAYNENQTTYLANGTFSTGWAFFDEVNLGEINATTYDAVAVAEAYENDMSAGATDAKVNLSTENIFLKAGSEISADFTNVSDDAAIYDDNTLGTPYGFSSEALLSKIGVENTLPVIDVTAGVVSIASDADFTQYGIENPGTPYAIESERALMMKANNADSYYEFTTAPIYIEKNSNYRLSFWVKTVGIKSTSGVYAYIMLDDTSKSSFTLINTSTYTTEDDGTTTEESVWTEYTFYIRGNETDANNVNLKFTFGTGDRWTSSTLANGAAFISNLSLTAIEYDDYSDASSGTYVKLINLASSSSSSSSFTNGSFSSYDYSETKGLDEENAGGTPVLGQLENNDYAAVPSSWTLSDSTYKPSGDDVTDTATYEETYIDDANLVAGIVKLVPQTDDDNFYNASYQIKHLFGDEIGAQFDTLYGAEDDTYFDNINRIGAPYVLALAGLNSHKYTRAYTSNSFSLTAATNYKLSVWVKTLEATTFSIYLTGGSSGSIEQSTNFVVKTAGATDWTQYTFYIQVGLTSVSSLKLKLGLGYDTSISGTLEGYDVASTGIVLFDNVTLSSDLTDDEFDAISVSDSERKLTYLTDGFDSASDTVSSQTTLSSPSGWTGSADTDQTASNTKSGVVYADASTLPKNDISTTDAEDANYKDIIDAMGQTVSLFGKTYKASDYTIEQEELDEAKASGTYGELTDDEITTILQKRKMYTDMKDNYISASVLTNMTDNNGNDISSVIGKNYLVINNTVASSYLYTSSSLTLSAESFYRVSVYVRTYKVTGAGASVEFYLGSADDDEDPLIFKSITSETWTKYTFFVKTLEDDVTSVTLTLQLGEYDADDSSLLSSGYAMFDAIEIEIIDESAFDEAVASDYVAVRTVKAASESGDTEEEEEEESETPDDSFNLVNLAWMIPSIVIAIATIAVVIVFFVKKYRKPVKEHATEETNAEAVVEKRSKYDDYNE